MKAKALTLAISMALAATSAFAQQKTIYVDNIKGSDAFDGSALAPVPGKASGPLASIGKAFSMATPSCKIEVANTGKPYQGGNALTKVGGTKEQPLTIEGHGATISGLGTAAPEKWTLVKENIYGTEFYPMSNMLKGYTKIPCWIGNPKIWFLDGKEAPNCETIEALEATPGGFMWDKPKKTLLVNLPAGKTPSTAKIEFPVHNTSMCVNTSFVTVSDFKSVYSWNDGFDTHGSGKNIVYRNCVATDNCGQAFSIHDTTSALYEDCVGLRNASCGISNPNECVTVFRRCVVSDNTFEAGVRANHTTVLVFESCVVSGNKPFEQIWQQEDSTLIFENCLIDGGSLGKDILTMVSGTVLFNRCVIANASAVCALGNNAKASLTIANSLVAGMDKPFIEAGARFSGTLKLINNRYAAAPGILIAGKLAGPESWQQAAAFDTDGKWLKENPLLKGSFKDALAKLDNRLKPVPVEYPAKERFMDLVPEKSILKASPVAEASAASDLDAVRRKPSVPPQGSGL